MADEHNHSLIVPFLTDDPVFAQGCEVGMLHERMKRTKRIKDFFLRENQEQILLMANRAGWRVIKVEPYDDGWFYLNMRRKV